MNLVQKELKMTAICLISGVNTLKSCQITLRKVQRSKIKP